jgi:List-Bact-rpt repeat protein
VSDVIAGRPAGGGGEGGGGPFEGGPPPVLMAALGAATLIAVTLVALFGGFSGGGDDDPVEPLGAGITTTPTTGRVQLSVTFAGSGDGEIQIAPGDLLCSRSCDHTFINGTRVTVTADAASGSTFEGWGDACDGTSDCALVLDGERSLSATFEAKPSPPAEPDEPMCDGAGAAEDPACDDNLDVPPDEDLDAPADAPAPTDCADGRDNDRDGLTDAAQDPDCAGGGAEAGSGAAPGATAPPPPPPNDCGDGRDNDRDGLTDRAQDPDCADGRTEAG